MALARHTISRQNSKKFRAKRSPRTGWYGGCEGKRANRQVGHTIAIMSTRLQTLHILFQRRHQRRVAWTVIHLLLSGAKGAT